jgi:hypothetical protein
MSKVVKGIILFFRVGTLVFGKYWNSSLFAVPKLVLKGH